MIKLQKIGGDPEFILRNNITGEFVSAIPLIPGTKNKPFIPENMPEGFALQTDNVLVEFNIPPVDVSKPGEYYHNVQYMKDYIKSSFLPVNVDMIYAARARYQASELRHKQAKEFGCQPDLNAWTRTINEKPAISVFKGLRVAGAHIHISYENPSDEVSENFVKLMDLLIASPILSITGGISAESERRKMYGKAGSFRFTPYGFEYRVLSNVWLGSGNTVTAVFKMIQFIAANYAKLVNDLLPKISYDEVVNIVDFGKKRHKLLETFYSKFLSYVEL